MSYEQAPAFFPRDLPEDGKKRIFIEKNVSSVARDKEAQMSRLRRIGYVPDPEHSNEDADCMVIDQSIIDRRAKDREKKTSEMLLANVAAGVEGEDPETTFTKQQGRQNPESFFGGKEQ